MFERITEFENYVGKITGAPYVVATDTCTHAIELCLRLDEPDFVFFTPYTYLSVPMVMHKLKIDYAYLDEKTQKWIGEYKFFNTNIWDSARKFTKDMYRPGQKQCLSFGFDKPLNIGRGGAILLDNEEEYLKLKRMAYDGRNLDISPWEDQHEFEVGYHYKMTPEEASAGYKLLNMMDVFDGFKEPEFRRYPDLRKIKIK